MEVILTIILVPLAIYGVFRIATDKIDKDNAIAEAKRKAALNAPFVPKPKRAIGEELDDDDDY